MIIHRSMHPGWLSNTWLVADHEAGKAVLIDTGGPMEPILEKLREHRLELSHVLCTHHHYDHVENNAEYQRRFGCPVCGHAAERELFGGLDEELADGDELRVGDLHIRALHIPGHTLGQLGFLINEERVFTGDTLFRGSIGGTRAPGHTSFEDIRHSLMDVLMNLPKETVVHPGHMEASSVGEEWEQNPFIRAFRGLDTPTEKPCLAYDQPATLLLSARDYDGGQKCWVRFEESNRLDVVPGSRVKQPG
ncbi:MAG: MBL fold metallo-hydrolase [Planctomycetota bacterium]|jgi:glyoxylase-like metal-dependent hydrolase (beta-lactamase superfamily II)